MIDTLILDRGHAALDSDGHYDTAPAKMHTFSNGKTVYEGEINNNYLKKISLHGKAAGYNIEYTVEEDDPSDPKLSTRVIRANNSINKNSSLFVSIHNNASPKHNATGSEIWTSLGQTLSDIFAEEVYDQWAIYFEDRLRIDTTDGDKDKEAKFYVLHNTLMPAILLEIGFFDNMKDLNFITSYKTIDLIARLTIQGITNANRKLYGNTATWYLQDTI